MFEIGNIVFLKPIFLYVAIPFGIIYTYVVFWQSKRKKMHTRIVNDVKKIKKSFLFDLFKVKNVLIFMIIILFFLLFADPNIIDKEKKISKNGIDIVIALDVSKSMEATDLQPSRIEAAKGVVEVFINELESDRVGLVVFAGKPYISVPLTFDYDILKDVLKNIDTDSLNQSIRGLDGTAIGDSLLMAENILETKILDDKRSNDKKSKKREKIIVLLTDGDANRGADPLLVSRSLDDIKVYTIGIGSEKGGRLLYAGYPLVPPLNDENLRKISDITNGVFFRATDNQTLNKIFEELQKLEKHDIKVSVHKEYDTYYKKFIYVLVFLIFVYVLLNVVIFRN